MSDLGRVVQIDLTGVHSFVADNTNSIKRLLDAMVEPVINQFTDFGV